MKTIDTSVHGVRPAYEAPMGTFVRKCALGAAIGFTMLVGAMALAVPDLAGQRMMWTIWILVTLVCVVTYAAGSLVFRHSSGSQSRRTSRWISAGRG